MTPFHLLLLAVSLRPVEPPAVLPLSRQGSLLIVNNVYLNHHGPLRMLIDTGSASCSIPQALARRLGLKPAYAVQQETAAGNTIVAATILDEVTTGPVTRNGVEALILPDNFHGVDGVLGQSWLARRDYLIDYRARRIVFHPDPPLTGVKLELHYSDDRPSVAARVGGRDLELVLDSGADRLVLFGATRRLPMETLFTANGSTGVQTSTARVSLGGEPPRMMRAVHVSAADRPGLMPLAEFSAVYVSNERGLVVLVR